MMKTNSSYKFGLLITLTAAIFLSCCKEDPETDLPRPEYFSCYINGELFTTQRQGNCDPIKGTHADGSFGDTVYNDYVVIQGAACNDGKSVTIRGHKFKSSEQFQEGLMDTAHWVTASYLDINIGTFPENNFEAINGTFKYDEVSLPYKAGNTPYPGYAEGTFEFVGVNSLNDTVHITSGQFGVILH